MHFEPWLSASQKGLIQAIRILHSAVALTPHPGQATVFVLALHVAILLGLAARSLLGNKVIAHQVLNGGAGRGAHDGLYKELLSCLAGCHYLTRLSSKQCSSRL